MQVDFSTRVVDLLRDGYDVVLRAMPEIQPGLVARTIAIVPAVQIDRAIVGDAEQPRAQRRHLVELRQRVVGTRERVLDDVFPVGDRPGHPRAVAV